MILTIKRIHIPHKRCLLCLVRNLRNKKNGMSQQNMNLTNKDPTENHLKFYNEHNYVQLNENKSLQLNEKTNIL